MTSYNLRNGSSDNTSKFNKNHAIPVTSCFYIFDDYLLETKNLVYFSLILIIYVQHLYTCFQ